MAGKMILYKLVVLGDGGVGKTALTIQLCLQHFVETYDPTIEDSYRKQVVIDGQACMLEVLDTAGQEEYTALRDQWIQDSEGFVMVYSISSRLSFSRVRRYHYRIQQVKEFCESSPSYPGSPIPAVNSHAPVPIMLVGNKSDQVTEREVSIQEGQALARELGCGFVETSAKNCINVEKAFYDVVRILQRQRYAGQRPIPTSGSRQRPAANSDYYNTPTLRFKDLGCIRQQERLRQAPGSRTPRSLASLQRQYHSLTLSGRLALRPSLDREI
ncbi:ras family-domain-containing protein [Ilyonectria sp. MPI-CAGE-AT-0026]|nr:ras family-domain-containing protein [Ilyonectria sp. MPI-CAGE-AT-0026]